MAVSVSKPTKGERQQPLHSQSWRREPHDDPALRLGDIGRHKQPTLRRPLPLLRQSLAKFNGSAY
jgi:hypothetical protein